MLISNVRKILIFLILACLGIYFIANSIVNLDMKSYNEMIQSSYRIDEYSQIIYRFANDLSSIGEEYLIAENVRIDEDIYDLVYNSDSTYSTPYDLINSNSRLLGHGTQEYVMKNAHYINLAYIFESFFSDMSTGFANITSVNYYSKHNFIYTYSNVGIDYLEKINFYDEKASYEKIIRELGSSREPVWDFILNSNYLDEKELVLSIPVYGGDVLEGVISINFSTQIIQDIVNNNFYETYLIYEDGTVIASNSSKAILVDQFTNIKDEKLFGSLKGQSIINSAFNIREDDNSTLNSTYYKFSDYILNKFTVFIHVPMYLYFPGALLIFATILVVGKIAFWLDDTYEKSAVIRRELKIKYEETSKLKIELEKVAEVDFLTKLDNRRTLVSKIDKFRKTNITNQNANFVLLIMDIDFFKKVNDRYGHAAGDEVLKKISKTISTSLRKSDIVSRWGGEEILVVIANSNLQEGKIVAEKIRKKVEMISTEYEDNSIKVTLSIGVNILKMTENFDAGLAGADEALYNAKETGRNKVVLYDDISS